MSDMVPSPVHSLAIAAREILTRQDTPAALRTRLVTFISELRDSLPPDEAKRLDGLEAEAVITSFAAEPSSVR